MSNSREISQLSSFIHVDDVTNNVAITTDTLPYVGIGTTQPSSKLTVDGDVNVSGVITANAFVGDGSGLTGLFPGIFIKDEGIQVGSATTFLNFVGTGVSAVSVGNTTEIIIDLQGNIDGGFPLSNYGGIENVNGGSI